MPAHTIIVAVHSVLQQTAWVVCRGPRSDNIDANHRRQTSLLSLPFQAMVSLESHWDHLLLTPSAVPCVVESSPLQKQMAPAQPPQRRTPAKNLHLPPPASSGRRGRRTRQCECSLDSGTWLLHPQPQPHQPWPTSRLPLCLIHHPLCTMQPQHLPQSTQLPHSLLRDLGEPGTLSSWV